MSSSNTRHLLCGSVAALLASVFFAGCSGGTGAPVGTTGEAVSASDDGLFHTGITRANWRPGVGNGSRPEFDNGIGCRPKPLDLCPLFDEEFIGVDGGKECEHVTTSACPDRADTWGNAFLFAFLGPVSSDCRFGQWAAAFATGDAGASANLAQYLNDLIAFSLKFFGCPVEPPPEPRDPFSYGLIPFVLEGDQFTTADLDTLSDAYLAGVQQALADNGSPPLTDEQVFLVRAKLHRLARRVPNTVFSPNFNFSTCAPDAAVPEASPAAIDDFTCF
jgi:hypothetical protein